MREAGGRELANGLAGGVRGERRGCEPGGDAAAAAVASRCLSTDPHTHLALTSHNPACCPTPPSSSAPAAATAAAPGQPTLQQLTQVYGLQRQRADTAVMGIVGNPVGHSRSPAIHNAALQVGVCDVHVCGAVCARVVVCVCVVRGWGCGEVTAVECSA